MIDNCRDYFRLKLSPTSGRCPWWLIFFKNLFHRKNYKQAMKIRGGQIWGALFNFFVVKKCPFLHLPDAALSFYNNPWSNKRTQAVFEKKYLNLNLHLILRPFFVTYFCFNFSLVLQCDHHFLLNFKAVAKNISHYLLISFAQCSYTHDAIIVLNKLLHNFTITRFPLVFLSFIYFLWFFNEKNSQDI